MKYRKVFLLQLKITPDKNQVLFFYISILVRMTGVEPTRPKASDSKSDASASSATPATQLSYKILKNYNSYFQFFLDNAEINL